SEKKEGRNKLESRGRTVNSSTVSMVQGQRYLATQSGRCAPRSRNPNHQSSVSCRATPGDGPLGSPACPKQTETKSTYSSVRRPATSPSPLSRRWKIQAT